VISCAREITAYTAEFSPSFTVSFINTTASRTRPGSITGVNLNKGDAHSLGFVLDKALKLVKRPVMQRSSLRLANRYPITNALKVFQGNRFSLCLGLCYNAFADDVVGVARKATLFTRQFFEPPLGRLGLLLLEFTSKASMSMSDMIDVATRAGFALSIGSDIDNPQVDPQHAFYL
jgi:hypothetical protein